MDSKLKNLSACHVNIRGLNEHKVSAIKANLCDNHDIITISETFLSNNSRDDLCIQGYHDIIRKDRTTFGGGVAVYVKSNLSFVRKHEYECDDIECIWLILNTHDGPILLCTVYRPPSNKNFWEYFESNLDYVKSASKAKHMLIMGDLNADYHSPEGKKLSELCLNYNLTCHIHVPTRITQTSQSCLDQIMTNMPNFVVETNVFPPVSTNDHCTVSIKLRFKLPKEEPYLRHMWLYEKGDYDGFRECIANFDWNLCFASNDIDLICESWTDTLLNIARSYIPNKMVLVRPNDKPWYNNELRCLKRKINRLHKNLMSQTPGIVTDEKWHMYISLRNTYKTKLDSAVNEYNVRLNETLRKADVSEKKWWSTVNKLIGKGNDYSIPPMYDSSSDLFITQSKLKADAFNKYFLSHNKIDASNAQSPEYLNEDNTGNCIQFIQATETEVLDQIKALKVGKATGPDNISPRILKEAGAALVPSLTKLINKCLTTSSIPDMWKRANVIPIHKQNERHLFTNYRPISLLSVVSKILERVVFKHVYNFLLTSNLLSKHQSGFRSGDSTVNQLSFLYHAFSQALDAKKDVKIVFCDVSKAFDKVWHNGLLYKLQKAGIRGNLLTWFQNYLTHRTQRVVIKGQHSSWGEIEAGVPQGSVLGPLLFLVYINDLTDEIDCNIKLFADDTTLYITVDDQPTGVEIMNSNLKKIKEWANTWLVNFNPSKTVCMTLSSKKQASSMPILFDDLPLNEVSEHKHLGVIFNNKLTWTDHIQSLLSKVAKMKNVMLHLKNRLDRNTLNHIYLSFVRPKLEYASIVWSDCNEKDKLVLEKCQRDFARIVTGARKGTRSELLHNELNWPSLEERRQQSILVFMHRLFYGQCPEYLNELLPDNEDRSQYNLRNRNSISQFKARTEKFRKSLVPSGIRLWNSLPPNVQSIQETGAFKKALFQQPVRNDLYNIGARRVQIVHAQLRMNCSILADHLYKLHVKDSPNCLACGEIEDCNHFFFHCKLYHVFRTKLCESVSKIGTFNIQTVLFGDPNLSEKENVNIFGYVHQYIQQSGRFDM